MTYARDENVRALAAAMGESVGQVRDAANAALGAVAGVAPNVRKINTEADRAPLPSDDETQGFASGSRWQWQGREWTLVDAAAGSAAWVGVTRYDVVAVMGLPASYYTAIIQRAIDAVAAAGGGAVVFGPGVFVSGPLTLRSGVVLEGQGHNATELRLASGSNTDFIVSEGFASLTGQNKWLVADGVPHGLGFRNMRINGNKTAQTSGDGVNLYAKRLIVENVIIYDCHGRGWYSEAGDIPGQQGWQDLPESQIEGLWVRASGSHGFHFLGPHDAHIEGLVCNQNGGDGVRFERVSGVHSGSCDVQFIHSYANAGRGVYINAGQQGRYQQVISEANFGEGIVCEGWWNQFTMVQTYNNCRSSGTWSFNISGSYNSVQEYQHKDSGSLHSCLRVRGNKNSVNIKADGGGSAGTGIDVSGQFHRISGHVEGFSGAGGAGLLTGAGPQLAQSSVSVSIEDCATLWRNASVGATNLIAVNGYAAAGQVSFSGQGPDATDVRERWDVRITDHAGGAWLSEIKKLSGGNINLNTTAEQTITVGCAELLGLVPEPEDVQFSIHYTGTNAAWALQYIRLSSITASLLTFKVKLSQAAGADETAKLLVRCALT